MTSVAYVPVMISRDVWSLPAHVEICDKFPFFQFHWKDLEPEPEPEPPTPGPTPGPTPPPDNEEGKWVEKVDKFLVQNDPGPAIGNALAQIDPGPAIGNALAQIDPGPAFKKIFGW